MTEQLRRENEPPQVQRLREAWPDWEIVFDWYGCLIYPKGTKVFVFRYPDGIDDHLREAVGGTDTSDDGSRNTATASQDPILTDPA